MKKFFAVVLAAIFIAVLFPLYASAEEIKAPTIQYKILNHDNVSLKWSKVEGAESYYIYKRDDKTGKYIKKFEVRSNAVTLKNLSPDTEYSYSVAAVKGGEKSKSSNKVTFTTPSEWYYSCDWTDWKNGYQGYREHYDGSGREKNDMGRNIAWESKQLYYNGWIYYIDVYDENMRYADDYFSSTLYKVKNDGTGSKFLYSFGEQNIEKIYAADNDIFLLSHEKEEYYDDVNDDDDWSVYECGLYKISLDGKERDKLYFMTDTENNHVKHITNYIVDFTVTADGIYYVEYSEKEGVFTDKGTVEKSDYCYKLYKMNTDGTDVKFIATLDDYSLLAEDSLFFQDDCIYYTTYSDGFCEIRKLSLDTNKIEQVFYCDTKMFDARSEFITEFINGYFYIEARNFNYDTNEYEYKYYRIKADGAGLKKQDKPFEWRY